MEVKKKWTECYEDGEEKKGRGDKKMSMNKKGWKKKQKGKWKNYDYPRQVGSLPAGVAIKATLKTRKGERIKVRGRMLEKKGEKYLIGDNVNLSFGPGTVVENWDASIIPMF